MSMREVGLDSIQMLQLRNLDKPIDTTIDLTKSPTE
jgi:aryl carrier-like protein